VRAVFTFGIRINERTALLRPVLLLSPHKRSMTGMKVLEGQRIEKHTVFQNGVYQTDFFVLFEGGLRENAKKWACRNPFFFKKFEAPLCAIPAPVGGGGAYDSSLLPRNPGPGNTAVS
jgi:hypothetical protein